MEVIDSELSRQYRVKQNEELTFVECPTQERKIFFTKTLLPESADGAFVDEFFKRVLALASQKKYKVVPVYPAAITLSKRNREYKKVLSAGIRT